MNSDGLLPLSDSVLFDVWARKSCSGYDLLDYKKIGVFFNEQFISGIYL